MTISNAEALFSGPYSGDGVTATFDYDFKIYDAEELVVERTVDDVTTTLVYETDYTVSGAGDAGGGNITLLDPATDAPTGATLYVLPNIEFSQTRPFSAQSSVSLNELEQSFDKITSITRQLRGASDRSIRLPVGSTASGLLPNPTTGSVLVWDEDGLTNGPMPGDLTEAMTARDEALASEEAAAISAAAAASETTFASRAAMLAATIPAAVNQISCVHDGRLVVFVRDANGTAATTADTATWSPAGDATPGHWGAVSDGSANASPAIQAMLDWCLSTAGGEKPVVSLPKGIFDIGTEIAVTWNSNGTALAIHGAGSHQTVFNVTNTSGAFDFDMSDLGIHKLTFTGVTFVAKAAADASITRCIRATGSGTNSARYDTVRMHDMTLEVDRENLLGSVFLTAIDLQQIIRPRLTYVFGWGRFGPGTVEADWNLMDVFVNMYDCYGPFLQHVRAWSCHTGFKQETTVAEGGQFEHVGTGGNNAYGVVLLGNDRTMGNFFECYFDSTEGGITATNVNDIRITETMFWCSNNYTPSPAERYDIKLINCQRAVINDTVHRFQFAAVTNTGIILDADCEDITIRNPSISSRDVGILDAGTDNRIIEPYFFSGPASAVGVQLAATCVSPLVDKADSDGSVTLIDDDGATTPKFTLARPYRARVGLTAAASIANDTATTITWTVQELETGGQWVTVPSQTLTIPSGLGIQQVKATFQTKWASNATGTREAWVSVDNVQVSGAPADARAPAALAWSNMSGTFDATGGDVIRALVKQTSGGALNLGPGTTWLLLEAVN